MTVPSKNLGLKVVRCVYTHMYIYVHMYIYTYHIYVVYLLISIFGHAGFLPSTESSRLVSFTHPGHEAMDPTPCNLNPAVQDLRSAGFLQECNSSMKVYASISVCGLQLSQKLSKLLGPICKYASNFHWRTPNT